MEQAGILPGKDVLTEDGVRLGRVKGILLGGRYFQVDCRMAPDYFVPVEAVASADGGSVLLRVTGVQAANMGWEARPRTP